MTLHYEAMRAEIDYRHEQARRSWPVRAPKPEAAGRRRRLWSVATRWARLLNWRRRSAASAPPLVHDSADHHTSGDNIVQVHITCWTDGSQSADQVLQSIQDAVVQQFPAAPQPRTPARRHAATTSNRTTSIALLAS